MPDAIGYRRISETDQSNSLETQGVAIERYCAANNLTLKQIFTDNGRSAFTFNRPEWIKLEKYLKANKSVKYIVCYHIDRFSRATLLEALLKLREIEERLQVKVLTVNDTVTQNTQDLTGHLTRVMQLIFSNNELNRIKQRVSDGIYQSLCNGRFCSHAPFGYRNTKLSKEERKLNRRAPLIEPDPITSKYVQEIFSLYNSGLNIENIRRLLPEYQALKGNSAIQRILNNHIYAGIIKVPDRGEIPGFEVEAVHIPIITKLEYYKAIARLNQRKSAQQPDSEVFLRGIVACHCGRKLTAGKSTGKSGRQYWYYKCNTHKENFAAEKVHSDFLKILKVLSFGQDEVEEIKRRLNVKIDSAGSKKGGMIMQLNLEKEKLQKQLKAATEKFLLVEGIDRSVFEDATNSIKLRLSEIETTLIKSRTDSDTIQQVINMLLPKLADISQVFKEMPLHRQHQVINLLFPFGLCYNHGYTTPGINMLFQHKELILKENGLLKIEQPVREFAETPGSTPNESIIQHLDDFLKVFAA